MNSDNRTILLVEDNEDDAFIFSRAYRLAQLAHPVQVTTDGEEALDYLLGEGEYSDRNKHPLPFLIFLDLKLPLKSGHEVLQVIRSDPKLADIAVVVLTSSGESRDITRAQELGANAFLVKPPTPAHLSSAVSFVRAQRETPGAAVPRIQGDLFTGTLSAGPVQAPSF